MCLVDDDGEALALALDLLIDHGELLQGRDDETGAAVDGVQQVGRGLVLADGHDRAYGVVEARDGLLQLAVEHSAVGDDDHGVEQRGVIHEEGCQAIGRPSDAVRLARARGMLDEVVLARSVLANVGDDLAHGIELVIAREDNPLLLALHLVAARVELRLLLDFQVEELVDDVEQAVLLQGDLPQVARSVAVGICGVARSAVVSCPGRALVEGQEEGLRALQLGGHVHVLEVDGEKRQHARVELETAAPRVAVLAPLAHGVLDILAGELVLELYAHQGDAVHVQDHVDGLVARLGEVELADAAADVLGIAVGGAFVEPALWLEEYDLELDSSVFEAVLEHRDHAQTVDGVVEDLGELRRGVGVAHALEALPSLGLRRLDEVDQGGGVERAVAVLHVAAADHLIGTVLDVEERVPVVALKETARRRAEKRLDVLFEVLFLGLRRHVTTSSLSTRDQRERARERCSCLAPCTSSRAVFLSVPFSC